MRFLACLLLLVAGCLAETLSTGQDVANLVSSKIEENEVSGSFGSCCGW
jgi:hypothetical protein